MFNLLEVQETVGFLYPKSTNDHRDDRNDTKQERRPPTELLEQEIDT